jgi:hypothetical protein
MDYCMFRYQELYTSRILPPATPPLISLTSEPGLFTSKELITIVLLTLWLYLIIQIEQPIKYIAKGKINPWKIK